jgi:hypothetical protein
MTPAQIEKTKLVANTLDRACTACFTVGFATPLAGYIYDIGGIRASTNVMALLFGLGGWLLAALVLHLAARRILDRLDQ